MSQGIQHYRKWAIASIAIKIAATAIYFDFVAKALAPDTVFVAGNVLSFIASVTACVATFGYIKFKFWNNTDLKFKILDYVLFIVSILESIWLVYLLALFLMISASGM